MTLEEAMSRLEALGDENVRKRNRKQGAGDNQFGVLLGKIRKIAKEIKKDEALARELWATSNVDARMLATLIVRPKKLAASELDAMVRTTAFSRVADWLNAYVVKEHPDAESFRADWMDSDVPMAARAGWSLTAGRIAKVPEGLDFDALLDRVDAEMADADPLVQWTMNMCLVEIGINSPAHRERALEIGERLGVFRDYPTPKGCTSPFAPLWINEMVQRQG